MLKVRHWHILSGAFFFIYIGFTWLLLNKQGDLSQLDQYLLKATQTLNKNTLANFWWGITHLGDYSFCFMLGCVISILFAFFKRGITGLLFVLGLIGLPLIRLAALKMFGQPVLSSVFPSEPIMVSIVFYGYLVALLSYLLKKNGQAHRIFLVGIGFLVLMIGVSLSSFILEDQSTSNQLLGILMGSGWLCFIIGCLHLLKNRGFH